MLNLITKLAIYDPDTHEHCILTNIMEGVDGSAAFGWSEEVESIQIEDGQTYEHTLNGTLDIKVMRGSDADLAIIDGVVGKRAYISAITIDGFLLFDGEYYINRVPDFNSAILNDHIRFTAKRQKGYIPSTQSQGFYGGENGMMLFDVLNGYTDGSGNELLGGFEPTVASATYIVSSSGGIQQVTTTAAGNGGVVTKRRIFFPFTDEDITFSVDKANATEEITITLKGFTDHDSVATSTIQGSGTTGRISATFPRNTSLQLERRFFEFEIEVTGETTAVDVYFDSPALRLGTSDQFSY